MTISLALPAWTQSRVGKDALADPDLPSLLATAPEHRPFVSILRSFDGGLSLTSAHDSSTGWYTLATPSVSFAVSPHVSFDVATPIYLTHRVSQYTYSTDRLPQSMHRAAGPVAVPQTLHFVTHTWDPGDTFLAGHISFAPGRASFTVTPSLIVPTGDRGTGLSTGRTTFDLDQHVELPVRRFVTLLDTGVGDSSSVVNHLVTRDATSLGTLAHFQFGLATPLGLPALLRRGAVFSSYAYEQLPLSHDTYAMRTLGNGVTESILTGRHATEDNGFTNSLVVPLSPRVAVAGYYNRSLRLHLDTAAFSVQFNLRHRHASTGLTDDGTATLLQRVTH